MGPNIIKTIIAVLLGWHALAALPEPSNAHSHEDEPRILDLKDIARFGLATDEMPGSSYLVVHDVI